MPGKDVVENSRFYRSVAALYRYFLVSVSFTAVKGIGRGISGAFDMVFLHSKSRELFLSFYRRCAKEMEPLLLASILAVLVCHLSLDILITGTINCVPTLVLAILLAIVYFIKRYGTGAYD